MNIELWRQVEEYILAHPDVYCQREIAIPAEYLRRGGATHLCGTACCIAGTTVALHSGLRPHRDDFCWADLSAEVLSATEEEEEPLDDVIDYAAISLGLDPYLAYESIFNEDIPDALGLDLLRATQATPDAHLGTTLELLMVAWHNLRAQFAGSPEALRQALDFTFGPYWKGDEP